MGGRGRTTNEVSERIPVSINAVRGSKKKDWPLQTGKGR